MEVMKYVLRDAKRGDFRKVISSNGNELNCFMGGTTSIKEATRFDSIRDILLMCHRHGAKYPNAIIVFDDLEILVVED